MKTTLNVRDDLYRRAKAAAALQGKTLGRFLEESLERALSEKKDGGWSEWAENLPKLSDTAVSELAAAFRESDFREIDADMWQ